MPESIRNLGIFLNKKRRAAVQGAMRGGATAWLDQDDSGTYDPKLKRATRDECGTVKKGKRRKIVGGDEDGNLKSRKFYRKVGYSFMVALRLESEEGKEYLRSITPGPVESESSNSDSDSSGSSTDSDPGYGSFPKRRRKKRQPKRLGTSTSRYSLFALLSSLL
jgi:hypothetical protein